MEYPKLVLRDIDLSKSIDFEFYIGDDDKNELEITYDDDDSIHHINLSLQEVEYLSTFLNKWKNEQL